jgi:hypothetical protein
MKRLASILLVAAALGSCSKGNTDSPTPPAPSTSQISLVPSQPIDYISKIEEYVVSGYDVRTRTLVYTYHFEYDDQKRLISISYREGDGSKWPILYGDRTITLLYPGTNEDGGKEEDRLTLTPEGRVSEHSTISYKKNKEGVLVKEVTLRGKDYVYDSEGHQLSHTLTEYNTSSEWKDGNLVKRTFTYTGDQSHRRPDVLTQEYSSIPNRSFPDLNLIPKRFIDLRESRPYLWSHIKGTRSAKLISSQSLPLYENDGTPRGPMESRWAYKLDAKGRPIDLEMSLFFHNFWDRGMAYVITYLDK